MLCLEQPPWPCCRAAATALYTVSMRYSVDYVFHPVAAGDNRLHTDFLPSEQRRWRYSCAAAVFHCRKVKTSIRGCDAGTSVCKRCYRWSQRINTSLTYRRLAHLSRKGENQYKEVRRRYFFEKSYFHSVSRENAPLTYRRLKMTAKSVSCKRRWHTCAMDIAQVMRVKGLSLIHI